MKHAHKSDRRSLWSAGAWDTAGKLREVIFRPAPPGLQEFASGIARDRFGSRIRVLQTPETRDAVGFPSIIARVSKWTTKRVPSAGAPKAAAISYGRLYSTFI